MTPERAKGTDRMLDILERLFETDEPPTRNALAGALGMPRSTVYALVDQLLERGWLEQAPSGAISLGYKSGLLGLAYAHQTHFEQTAAEVLQQLVEETGQAAELNIIDNWQQLVVLAVKGTDHSYLRPTEGRRFPLPCTISARVLLDGVPASRLAEKIPPEHFLLTQPALDLQTLSAEIVAAKARGYAVGHGLIDRHIGVVAAPVRDKAGQCIAAISLIMMSAEMEAKLAVVVPTLLQATQRLSDTLGLIAWPMGTRNFNALHAA